MDEHIEPQEKEVSPYDGLNMLEPSRFEFETQPEYKTRRKMLGMALKQHKKGQLCFIAANIGTQKGAGTTYIKTQVKAYLEHLEQEDARKKLEILNSEEDHVN